MAARRNFKYSMPCRGGRAVCSPQSAKLEYLWQAVRCSSAAPLYFKPFRHGDETYTDGGLLNNNPTLQALTEVSLLRRCRSVRPSPLLFSPLRSTLIMTE